jgi:predicted transcriptional regulator
MNNIDKCNWRRNKVLELSSLGNNEAEVAKILQISQPTVSRDLAYIEQQTKEELRTHIEDKVPREYKRCITGVNQILKQAWFIIASKESANREKLQALALAGECYKQRMDLATNSYVLSDALKFVEEAKGSIGNSKKSNFPAVKNQTTKQKPIVDNDIVEDTAVDNNNTDTSDIEPDTLNNELVSGINEANESAANEEEVQVYERPTPHKSSKIRTFAKEKEKPLNLHLSLSDIQRMEAEEEQERQIKGAWGSNIRSLNSNDDKSEAVKGKINK